MSGVVVAEGVVVIDADAKGLAGSIATDVEKESSATGRAGRSIGKSIFGGVVGGFAAVGGAQIVTDFFVGAITGASDLAETTSKASTIFGDEMGNIVSWAEDAEKKIGLSSAAATEAAAGFGNMFSQIGFTGEEAAKMSQNVVQMSADLGSFNNLPTADVADRISAALRGEYDSLQALIPNINAARVEQEAMAATGKTNAAELTAQEKAAAVLAIVQKDGAAAMGDFAKTADGAANTQKTLTATLEEQQSKLGTVLMPLWQGFLGFLTDVAIPTLSAIIDFIAQNASWLGPLALALGVATAAVWAFNIALYANPIGLIVAAIIVGVGLIVAAIIFLATHWDEIMSGLGFVIEGIYNRYIAPTVTAIGRVFKWLWESVIAPVGKWISEAFTNIGNVARNIFTGVSDFIKGIFNGVVDYLRGPVNTIIGFLNMAIDGANVIGGAFGVQIGHIPLMARGTASAPDAFIAGEAGPELIIGAGGARVYAADETRRKLGGSGNVEQHVEITVNEAKDPLGSAGRVAKELRKWGKR
jgi:phage-related protein